MLVNPSCHYGMSEGRRETTIVPNVHGPNGSNGQNLIKWWQISVPTTEDERKRN